MSLLEQPSVLDVFLRQKGFPGDAQQLIEAASWLEQHEISDPSDFCGLGQISNLHGARQRHLNVLKFLQGLVSVSFRQHGGHMRAHETPPVVLGTKQAKGRGLRLCNC